MPEKEMKTEILFCTDECFVSDETSILEKKPKVINVHGKKVHGWVVKIAAPPTDGTVPLSYPKAEEIE